MVPALLVGAVSLTPSMMPRSPVFQGLVTGLSAAVAYAVGVLVLHAVRWRPGRSGRGEGPRWTHQALRVGAVAAAGVFVLALWRWLDWQEPLHRMVDLPAPSPWERAAILLVAGTIVSLLLLACRVVGHLGRRIGLPLQRVLPAALATVVGVVALLLAAALAADRYVTSGVLAAIDKTFDSANNGVPDDAEQPRSPLRSGSPESLSPWDELGLEGRGFVGTGPSARSIARVLGAPAVEPIRVYAGLDSSEDLGELADLVVAELDRTGAFQRSVLVVAVPTGRGWVNHEAAEAIEHLYAGDTAIAALQYSYLPSPLSFLVDPERAKEAGRELVGAVRERWAAVPPARRPTLLVYGESLGSTGAQAAFDGLPGLRESTDGALFVGPPESNDLWRQLVERRDAGTSQMRPVYDGGATARFAAAPADLARPTTAWGDSRVVFLQNPTDPIVWWSPGLAWERPDWSREREASDAGWRWFPVVTFLQVSADMVVSTDVPAGHGHRYADFVDYWAAIAAPPGWDAGDTRRLAAALE